MPYENYSFDTRFQRIFLEGQNGKERAGYGKFLLKNLSIKLSEKFGNGFSEENLN